MSQELAVIETERHLNVDQVLGHINFIKEVMQKVMIPDQHFGIIPGCKKPSLLKAGAEILFKAFHLRAEYEKTIVELENGHREYQFSCEVYSIGSGRLMGQGYGSASTLENKWRYKGGVKEFIGKEVPKEYWNFQKTDMVKAKEAIGGAGFGIGKNPDTNKWEICVFGEKIENDNPADLYNTVLKMAKKRCMVDGAITVTGCSDIFTQDMEEEVDNEALNGKKEQKHPGPQEKKAETAQEPQKEAKSAETATETPKESQNPPTEAPKQENPAKKTDYKGEIRNFLIELSDGNPERIAELIKEATKFKNFEGVTVLDKVSEKALPIVYSVLKKKVEALGTKTAS